MIMIVGLGNIGSQYTLTRHNIGFMTLDALTADWQDESRLDALAAKVELEGQDVLLVKPTTMMNNSGQAVGKMAQYYHIAPEDIWVVYDELDLPLGRLKIATNSSENGHKGLLSITSRLGHNRYWKYRLGIDTRQHREIPGPDFVLQDFTQEEQEARDKAIELAVTALRASLASSPLAAMQEYNKTASKADEPA